LMPRRAGRKWISQLPLAVVRRRGARVRPELRWRPSLLLLRWWWWRRRSIADRHRGRGGVADLPHTPRRAPAALAMRLRPLLRGRISYALLSRRARCAGPAAVDAARCQRLLPPLAAPPASGCPAAPSNRYAARGQTSPTPLGHTTPPGALLDLRTQGTVSAPCSLDIGRAALSATCAFIAEPISS
jgi:hypothetical protein